MIVTLIDQKASKVVPILLAAAVSSLITSWALKTPELGRKAEKLQVVETHDIPKLKSIAGCQTLRANTATTLAKASEKGADVNLAAIPNCASLKPIPRVPASAIGPKFPS